MNGSIPPSNEIAQRGTHRLIPSEHSYPVLEDLADDDDEMSDVFELDGATSGRLLAQHDDLPEGIHQDELVSQVPHTSIINAAFCYPRPEGGRFNSGDRGAWYAGFEIESSIAEVTFHHTRYLAEIGRFEDDVTKTDWLADFDGRFHDLREIPDFEECLDPDVDSGHGVGQPLAERLLVLGSEGIVFPSARNEGGTNIACFRPALIRSVRRGATYRFVWSGREAPTVEIVTET